jgi:FtsH-binding integral membrane protein
MAAILTLAAVIGLTIYAFYTKTDFTTKGSALFMFALILLVFFVFALIFQSKVLFLFYALLCCVLFGLYLIYDTQLIIGGRVIDRF